MDHYSWNKLPRLLIFPFELYYFARPFLGDLTPNGEKCGSKHVSPIGGGMSSNGGEIWGEEKGEIMDLGGGQADIG